jgi:hypothetical protein
MTGHEITSDAETLTPAASAVPDSRRASQVNPNAVLAVVAFAQFMVILDATIVNVAVPTIKGDLRFSEQSLSWPDTRVRNTKPAVAIWRSSRLSPPPV